MHRKSSIMNKFGYNPVNKENENSITRRFANATEADLPILFDLDNPESLAPEYIIGFIQRVKEDTGWDCVFHYYGSEDDEQLHCTVEVNKFHTCN